MTNAVKRQDVQPLQFGGEAWLRRLQLRRSKINHENKSCVDCHRNSNSFMHCHRYSEFETAFDQNKPK
jgi:hypothetical protein